MDTPPPGLGLNHPVPAPLYDAYAQQLAYRLYDQAGMPFDSGWLHPKRIMRVIRHKWITIFLVATFCLTAAFFYLGKTTPLYRAHSQIEMSVRRPRILTQQAAVIEDPGGSGSNEEVFNTRMERFKGRTVMQAALENLLTAHPHALQPEQLHIRPLSAEQDREARLQALIKNLQLSLLRRTRIVQITFEHPDPVIAAAVCNAFAEAAETSSLQENRVNSDAAVAWLESQEATQKEALQEAEVQLLQYLAISGIDALESRRKTANESLLAFNRVLVEVQSEEARAKDLRLTLESLNLSPELAGNLPTGIPREAEIRTVMEQWRSALVERQQLLSRFTENHPEVKAKDRLIALYRDQAGSAIKQARNAAAANEALLRQQADSLRKRKEEQANIAHKLDIEIAEVRTRLAALELARDSAEQSYRGILARIQDARMAADENTATVKIVERAIVPELPVHPRKTIILGLALLIGLSGGTGLALLVDHLEDRVADLEDLNTWGVATLAAIPRVRTKDRASVALASLKNRFSEVTEAFAGLRAMLDSPQYQDKAQVVLLTSSMPGEGKTVSSCNLAAAWAQKKRRVLLIDFDLRRPRLGRIFSMPKGQPGLLEALSDGQELETGEQLVFTCTDSPTLDIVATRPVSGASPAELAGTAAVERLIAWARKHYDHIVIDAPPMGLVSDALALAPLVDNVLIMVRPATSRKRVTRHTIQRFQDAGKKNISIILNDVDFSTFGHGSQSPYYHYNKHYKVYHTGS